MHRLNLFFHAFVGLFKKTSPALVSIITLAGLLGVPMAPVSANAPASNGCQLNSAKGDIQHVIEVQFDNTHFTRDNPNVPSDLEQMPNLLNFIKNNGVLMTNHHTPLISHTATDILTTLTGVYGDQMGVPVSNSFRYFKPDGTSNTGVSFAYWTSPLFDPTNPASPTDTQYNMLTAAGHNAPAPWVPYTRAGLAVTSWASGEPAPKTVGISMAVFSRMVLATETEPKLHPARV
jgi:hypothetical protein